MPNDKITEAAAAAQRFQEKYGFEDSFLTMYEAGKAKAASFKYVDDFVTTSDGLSYENRQYLNGMTYMLDKFVTERIKPDTENEKSFKINDLNVLDFVKEYEELVQLTHELKSPNTPRKPYEGLENELLKRALAFTKTYNKSVIDVFADKINSGEYTLSDLQNKTETLYMITDKSEKLEDKVRTASLISRAMDKIANERTLGFKLNPLNWPRMFREYQYRNRLTELLNAPAVREANFKLRESITEVYSNPMIDDQQLKEIETHQKERETAIQAERENEKQAKINAARSPLAPVVEANDPPAKTEVKQKQTEVPTKTVSKDI